MIRKIHLISLGDKPTFSDTEQSCLNSLKKIYPDFEIKVWRNQDCLSWINESKFASYNFNMGFFAYVSDYLRCKILYEEGGLYLDTDVYAMERIPDSYFEKSFLAWDVYNVTTNNGTCFYASEPHLQIFKEFCDIMTNQGPVQVRNGSGAANDLINEVLRKYGLDMSVPGYCDRDQDLGEIMILNRAQFGGRARDDEGYSSENIKPYLIHVCSGTWTVPMYYGNVRVRYALIKKDTDMIELKGKVRNLVNKGHNHFAYVFFMGCQKKFDAELKEILNGEYYTVHCVPCGNERKKIMDYIGRKISDIRNCCDIMRRESV